MAGKHCIVLLGLAVLILPACAATRNGYSVTVRSSVYKAPSGDLRYLLLPCAGETGQDSMKFEVLAPFVAKMLADLGYRRTDNVQSADMAVFAACGMGSEEPSCEPQSFPAALGQETLPHILLAQLAGSTSGRVTPAASRLPPLLSHTTPMTVYRRYLVLLALKKAFRQGSDRVAPLWKATAVSTGYSADLREVLPFMLAALKPHIGKDEEKEVTVPVKDGIEDVKPLKEDTP